MIERLLLRDGAVFQKLLHDGMIPRQKAHHAVAQKIHAGIAHVGDLHFIAPDHNADNGRSHAGQIGVVH